ncbi:fibroleukin-like [Dysidea avara]|uniref:fibroleukin-like n=1 Tax=Dysidea avara TaxID=196820 RepID=UPI00332B63C3
MKTVLQLVTVILPLLLVNGDDGLPNHYTTNPSIVLIKSCCDLRIYVPARVPSGVYKMSMGTFGSANVYCDMTTADGGWIVIQRNRNGSFASFNRNWREYEDGFGDLTTEFWYGLKLMHALTQTGQWEMRVDFKKKDGSLAYIHYDQFKVGCASERYKLTVKEYTDGDGDYFTGGSEPANSRMFTTLDNDNDAWNSNCAIRFKSGWWFDSCFNINPNLQPPYYNHPRVALMIDIKIRPKDCIIC